MRSVLYLEKVLQRTNKQPTNPTHKTKQTNTTPTTTTNSNVEQYPHAELVPGLLVVRLDAPIYFANVQVRGVWGRVRGWEACV